MCWCCHVEPITIGNFHCGHVVSKATGGKLTLTNLRPICALCNGSMGTKNLIEFVRKNEFWTPEGVEGYEETKEYPESAKREPSPWNIHVSAYLTKHPGVSFKEALTEASKTYTSKANRIEELVEEYTPSTDAKQKLVLVRKELAAVRKELKSVRKELKSIIKEQKDELKSILKEQEYQQIKKATVSQAIQRALSELFTTSEDENSLEG